MRHPTMFVPAQSLIGTTRHDLRVRTILAMSSLCAASAYPYTDGQATTAMRFLAPRLARGGRDRRMPSRKLGKPIRGEKASFSAAFHCIAAFVVGSGIPERAHKLALS
jgi:hypothetical protein